MIMYRFLIKNKKVNDSNLYFGKRLQILYLGDPAMGHVKVLPMKTMTE